MHTLFAIALLLGVVSSMEVVVTNQEVENMHHDGGWQVWKTGHDKRYGNEGVERVRYQIWKDNLRRIVEHNKKSTNLFLGMNKFGDLTNAEYRSKMLSLRSKKVGSGEGSTFLPPSNIELPDAVDWRTKGYVTPVKDQKQCGSCWAFSATGSLEGQHFRKTGKLVSLSEQNLVDCSRKFGNEGCDGGLMDYAFLYIKHNKGIDTEASYPYKGKDDPCTFKRSTVGANDTGFVDIKSGSEAALKQAVATVGPISVGIDASHFSFQFYVRGVYEEDDCSSTELDHGVLAVGYGVSPKGRKYWLVKNSWNTDWGQKGYIWMARDYNNNCGIATQASYPLV